MRYPPAALRDVSFLAKLLLVPFYVGLVIASLLVLTASDEAKLHYDALIALDSPTAAAAHAGERFLESLTVGLYKGARETRKTRSDLQRALRTCQNDVTKWTALVFSLIAVSAAFLIFHRRRAYPPERKRAFLALHLCGCAAVCLFIGVTAPVLTIVASQEIPLLGRVVASHETKSFIGTVQTLVARETFAVAFLLAFFSLVVPSIKLLLTSLALAAHVRGHLQDLRRRLFHGLHHLGRWSMTDVFVVAILVAFFGTNKAETTDAHIGPGLYFFAAHTVLAVLASILAPRN